MMKKSVKILFLVLILQQIICGSSGLYVNEYDSNDIESDLSDSSNETSFNDLVFDLKKFCNLTDADFNDIKTFLVNYFLAEDPINYGKEINLNETTAAQLCFVNYYLMTYMIYIESDLIDTKSTLSDSSNEISSDDTLFLKELCNLTDADFIDIKTFLVNYFIAEDPINYGKKINLNETNAAQLCFVNNCLKDITVLTRSKRSTRKERGLNFNFGVNLGPLKIGVNCKKHQRCNWSVGN